MSLLKNKFHVGVALLSVIGNLAFLPSAEGNVRSNLSVTVKGLQNNKGQVCFSLFSSSRGFPSNNKRAIKAQCVKLKNGNVKVNIPSLKAGTYAVAMFHDRNSDGKLNTNALGIPKEGFGFSRNPSALVGPPEFGEAVVLVAGTETRIEIELTYF